MLSELSIKNFAIIETLSISFEKGLTVLTGETGAGKSIIIDAIHLLVGGRGSSDFVRHGENRAEIEGLFLLEKSTHPVISKAQELGIDIEDEMIVLRREITKSGKSVCRINGKLVTISILREIGARLVDIHGQHEHQELMDESKHLSLLDQFGHKKISAALLEYRRVYDEYQQALRKLKSLTENEQQTAQRVDLYQFQLNEIEQAQLQLDEDEALLEEKKRLSNFERIYEAIQASYSALKDEQKGLDWIGLVMGQLEDAAGLNSEYKELAESVSNSYYMLEEAASSLRGELELLEFDPERLNEIENRLNEINGLKRKYGQSIAGILEYGAKIEEELETLLNKESHIDQLKKVLISLKKDLMIEGQELTTLRTRLADKLTNSIHRELKELYMQKTVFEVHINSGESHISSTGMDQVEFYISTNPGEPLKPLSKIASGGELSRIMLALKSIFSKHQEITSIIFDEVDTGVSGRVAQAIAEKIYKVSIGSQVLCISHLPQVAAMSDTHLYIEKEILEGRTRTRVKKLNDDGKIKEIGRMISGVEITDITKEHAKELLVTAQEMKVHESL
ncbi:DNA repair protein RecN [Niallia sp. XMNu-256]|uniref:DNA repair protein RecN n=1 Tax=Niallia sp. XMNu-256 TaxID=3082444 RepID=UPI0030D192F3